MIDPLSTVVSSTSNTADRGGSDNGAAATPATSANPKTPPATPTAPAPADAVVKSQAVPVEQALRVVVEPTQGGVSYTYKLFDRATGQLVMELPREQAAKLSESTDYTPGQVISAKV